MGSPSTKVFLTLLPLLAACGGQGDAVFWGFQHATVTVSGESLTGYQVWEMYSERWERKQKEKFHVCSVVHTFSGTEADTSLEGCQACEVSYAVAFELMESDCDPSTAEREDLVGMTRLAIGAVSADLQEESPYPEASLGWYQSWDDVTATEHGYAWREPDPTDASWEDGVYVLWPAYAWQMD